MARIRWALCVFAAGLSAQSLQVSPANVSFGTIAVGGKSAAKIVKVKNDGSVDVVFTGFSLGGTNPADYSIASNTCPPTLKAGADCKVGLVFSPVAAALRTALLVIADNASGSPQKVALTGMGMASPALSFSPPNLQFSPGAVGQPQNPYTLTILNFNSSAATIQSIAVAGQNSGDFPISSDNCPIAPNTLPPYNVCSLAVTFTPSGIGLRSATLAISVVGQPVPQVFPLAGVGQKAMRALTFSPRVVILPPTPPGAYSLGTVQAANSGNSPVHLKSVTVEGPNAPEFQLLAGGCLAPGTILPQNPCFEVVNFQPQAQGLHLASLRFQDDAQKNPQRIILFADAPAGTNLLTLYPAHELFVPVGVGSSEIVGFEVQNQGTNPATLNEISFAGPNAPDFTVASTSCAPLPLILPPDGSCYAEVAFTPSATGTRTAELDVSGNASGDRASAVLVGQGQRDFLRVEVTGTPANFFDIPVGGQSNQQIEFLNTGNTNVVYSPFTLNGSGAGDFSIVSDGCSGSTGGIPPELSCYVVVSFSPQGTGLRVATLNSTENSGAGSQSILLVGGGTPVGDPLGVNFYGRFSSLVGVATQPLSVYVSNNSQTPVTLAGLSIAGGDASDFSIFENSCNAGRVLAPAGSCSVLLIFTPGAVGARVSDLQLLANAGGGPIATPFPLVGTGIAPSKRLDVPPFQGGFLPVPVGDSTQSFPEIVNSGTEPVSLSSFTLVGKNSSDFAILGSTCMPPTILPAGQGCNITLQFKPSATGARIASLQITDDAIGSPQFILLDSFGLSAQLALSFNSDQVSFGTEVPGTTSQAAQVYLNNAGNVPVNIAGFSLAGGEAADFSFDASGCPTTLSVDQSCPVNLFFSPSKLGIRAAELLVDYGAPAGPASLFLTGDGVAAARSVGFGSLPVNFDEAVSGFTVTQTLQIDNLGTASVTLNGFQIVGADAADFSVQPGVCTTGSAEILPGQNCVVTLAFAPVATGERKAVLRIVDNAVGSPQSVPLSGLGAAPSLSLELSPGALPFGPVPVGNTAGPQAFTIYNSGNAPVSISNFAIAGLNALDFAIYENSCGSSLAPGQVCNLLVTFTPLATGPRIAQLQVRDDAVGSPQAVQLTGTGQ